MDTRYVRTSSALLVVASALAHAPTISAAGECPPSWQPPFEYDTSLYPFTNRCIELGLGTLHYFDESPEGPLQGTVLMLHGNPSWSFLYRDIALGLLADGYRVVAPDFYGYGLSDKPALDEFGYRPRDHAAIIAGFVVALDLRELTLVVQDWGAPVGVAIAARQLDRFRALVVMNTFLQRLSFGNPGVNHLGVDFSLDNIVNQDVWRSTGRMPHDVGLSIASLYGPPGTPEHEAVRNAYWGPFLDLDTAEPLHPDIVAPTNIFAQNLLLSGRFLEFTNRQLAAQLAGLPLYLVWGHEDRMWGALRCDFDGDPVCPAGSQCRVLEGQALCLEGGQHFLYPQIDVLREAWVPENIIGELISLDGIHFIQEVEQDAIIAAIETVTLAATAPLTLTATPGPGGKLSRVRIHGAAADEQVQLLVGLPGSATAARDCGRVGPSLYAPTVLASLRADAAGATPAVEIAMAEVQGRGLQALAASRCAVSNLVRVPRVSADR